MCNNNDQVLSKLDLLSEDVKRMRFVVDQATHSANLAKNSAWYPLSDTEIVTNLYTGQFIVLDRRDLSVAPSLILYGEWELEFAQYFRSLISPGDFVFDVGANVGYFGLIATLGNGDGEVHYFEANPVLTNLMAKTCKLNALPDEKSFVVNSAIGDRCLERVTLFKPIYTWGSATLGAAINKREDVEEISINQITIDEYCKIRGSYKCDIMKIDVEGYEENVLVGMEQVLEENPYMLILMEYSFNAYSERFSDFLKKWFSKMAVFVDGSGLTYVADESELINRFSRNNVWCHLVLMR